ncbi:response regulator [Euzebya sp.]|uniref:response regulator transcription factor n=1 Tax=Euzebya sp. TaxID=1971409 RepID=UPI003515C6E7
MIRVLIADDNPVIRGGLSGLLDLRDDVSVVGEAGNGKEAVAKVRDLRPDVTLMDVRMPIMDGIEATSQVAEQTAVLMLTYAEDVEIVGRAIQAGARAYIVHGRFTPDELGDAIREVHAGGTHVSPTVAPALFELVRTGATTGGPGSADGLTEREIDVVNLIAQGRSNAEIAEALFVSEKTVKNHINRAYAKLGVSNRAEAIAKWLGTSGHHR